MKWDFWELEIECGVFEHGISPLIKELPCEGVRETLILELQHPEL